MHLHPVWAGNRSKLYAVAAVAAILLITPLAFAAGVAGTPHDFRSPAEGGKNTAYPNLAKVAAGSPCQACHVSHGARAPFLTPTDYGWNPETVKGTVSPVAGFCLGCHDGRIETSEGTDLLRGHDASSHAHKMEFTWKGNVIPGKSTGGEIKQGALRTGKGVDLPVYLLPGDSSYTVTCLSCHNPHQDNGASFLRTSREDLCVTCHQSR